MTPAIAEQLEDLRRNVRGEVCILCGGERDEGLPMLLVCVVPEGEQPFAAPGEDWQQITAPTLLLLDGINNPVSLRHIADDPRQVDRVLEGVLRRLAISRSLQPAPDVRH